jgi:competence protein ComEA
MALAATSHELLGRARARLGVLRPAQRLARRALFKGMLFAAFVVAVSLVGRAWALARLPRAEPALAAPFGADTRAEAPPVVPNPVVPAVPWVPGLPSEPPPPDAGAPLNGQGSGVAAARSVVAARAATGEGADVDGAVPAEGLVNLNTATATDLETLPYVGPKRAQAILALRAKIGRFKSVDDLLKVKGIGRATLKRMRPKLTVGAG